VTWESYLFAVAMFMAPCRDLTLEQVMDKASVFAVTLGRRDWAAEIWAHQHRARILAAAGASHGTRPHA
jgi:hypothetical protein